MPIYIPEFVSDTYNFASNPPILDKIVFTIDHIHQGGTGLYSTLDVVRHLVSKRIPVTIFLQCSDPSNLCALDSQNAQAVFNLDPNLVSFGLHTLPRGNSQTVQRNNLSLISNMILNITGRRPEISSYHGANAGPENGISFAGVQYARGIHSLWSTAQLDDQLNTPVMGLNTINKSFDFIQFRNQADLSATLFVHSAELTNGSSKKKIFDTLVKAVNDHNLQAVDYLTAMNADYATPVNPPQPPSGPTSPNEPCALRHFTNNRIIQFLRINSRDGVNGNFQVAELQRFLNELSLGAGVADGIFGVNTKLAVIGFQINNGLGADGIVGANSRASINSHCD
ncbi:MAG: peptidoglycan-binding domain-containing protein [Cocleimonas sp.]